MHILERINLYVQEIKKTPYVYSIQKLGIEIFIDYIEANGLNVDESCLKVSMINKLLLYWIPKNKKYLSEMQAYQVVYTIQDIYNYMTENQEEKKNDAALVTSTILELYGQEYMRVYKVRNRLLKLTKDPVIAVDPIVVDLNKYRNKKKKGEFGDLATTYEQGLFQVTECKEGGQVVLVKPMQTKQYKLLLEYPVYKDLKKGDLIHATIKRKLFYIYWELDEIKSYYLPQALAFL